ncbi:His Kinase A (phosphoacceptor) domain [Rhizoctonia solani]|uniref:histidine kinase n=1 Tax=Rhizoctonia solani TaxID=456999 RepID=A0A8H7LMC4_9AGAM|nr:His Kinase A (phosphoacceptor) domain [Rhizoctonia solani]
MPPSQRPSFPASTHHTSGTSTTPSSSTFTAIPAPSYTATTAPDSPLQPRSNSLGPSANSPPNLNDRRPEAPSTPHRQTNTSHGPLLTAPSSPSSNVQHPPNTSGPVKTTRFDRSALHSHWTRFKRTTGFGGPPGPPTGTGTGTGTGTSSVEGSGADDLEPRIGSVKGSGGVRWGRVVARTITSDGDLSGGTGPGYRERPSRLGSRLWGRRRRDMADMEMGRSGSLREITNRHGTRTNIDELEQEDDCEDAEVDAVVVDNQQFLSLDKSTQRSQSTHPHHVDDIGTPPTGPTGSTSSGVAETRAMVLLRYRIWPVIERFFSLHFHDPVSEAQYIKETFYTHKTLAFWASCFLILNWVLATSLLSQQPYILGDKIFVYGVAPVLTVPLPVFITFDWPRTRPWIYQIWLAAAVWSWAWYNTMFMYLCGNYSQRTGYIPCLDRDFLVLFYYVTGLPVIAIFALGQNRTVQTFMVISFVCTAAAFFVPYRSTWIRHILNLIIYHAFVLYINWMRETADRRLHVLRDQLKTQYKQTQKAQISERKSSDSKRRLTSYIFHEVRVPLNTALLAAQNLAGTNAIQREHEIEFNALEGSLNMMSKDSGRFETVSKPFAFHAVIRSMLVPLGLGASAKGLQLIVELDDEIDVQARLAAYRAQARDINFTRGEQYVSADTSRRRVEEWVAQRMEEGSEEDGIVMGDEMRLRQVVTNLASNACKFTEPGGRITLRTKLIIPGPENRARLSSDHRPSSDSSNKFDVNQDHREVHISPPFVRGTSDGSELERLLEHIVVRIEVQDTGVGIRQQDMEEKRLFSAFMQTSSGLRQGGKGTGLGLALVRHIVALSGGRLGVKSKRAVGSTFWVELPLGVGRKAVAGVHATRARDAAVDAINFSGGWNPEEVARNVDQATRNIDAADRSREALSPGVSDGNVAMFGSTPTHGAEDISPLASGMVASVEPLVASSSGASTGLGSGALLAAGAPATPLQSGSALKSIMEHGGVVELVPQLPMQSSHEEGPIVATRTLSPDTGGRPSVGNSPVTSRVGGSDSASRLALSDPTASRIVMSEPAPSRSGTGLSDSRVGLNDPTASRIVLPAELPRASPKPSAHRSMPSETSLPPLKTTAPAPSNGSPVRPTAGSAESLSPLRVLVVDDDSLTRRLMTRMLTRLGCTVENAENGQIALDMLLAPLPTPQSQRTQSSAGFPSPLSASIEHPTPTLAAQSGGWEYGESKYDIVFLDNHMPICSGVEVARRLRQLDRKDFVVGVTGNALTEDQQEYLQAGANQLQKSLKAMLVLADERRKTPGAPSTPSGS